MKTRVIETGKGSKSPVREERMQALQADPSALDSRIELIQQLIPLGLQAVAEELQAEVQRLVGVVPGLAKPAAHRSACAGPCD